VGVGTGRALLSVSDLTDEEVESLLSRAEELEKGASPLACCEGRVVGLVFLEASLRTRLGFAAAASRVGASFVEVSGQRASEISSPESLVDTMRTISSYVDVVVARPGVSLQSADLLGAVEAGGAFLVNGGDAGSQAEHPTQALIDLAAVRREGVPIGNIHIAVCGALQTRAVRSLLRLLARNPPRALTLIGPNENAAVLPPSLHDVSTFGRLSQIDDVDVLYVAGMPLGLVPDSERAGLIVDELAMSRLPPHAIVLSPMPVIDEMTDGARRDVRARLEQQSQHGLFVRMALLEHLFKSVGSIDGLARSFG
jgi:aspartate carbamoyltransferase catalytic subunit